MNFYRRITVKEDALHVSLEELNNIKRKVDHIKIKIFDTTVNYNK